MTTSQDGKKYFYQLRQKPELTLSVFIQKSRRKTWAISFSSDTVLHMKIPYTCSYSYALELLATKENWILKNYNRLQQRKEDTPVSSLTPTQRSALEERYRNAAKEYFPLRVAHYAALLGVTYERITIREQKTRWGSWSSAGNLNFNWKLMLAPPRVLDYVVVHELCHRKEMNHSKAFWAIVESILPDYKESRKWLKENGHLLQL